MKVTINKETGLGRPEHSRENYLPVISQSGEILTDGTWECEKVWQLYEYKTGGSGPFWLDIEKDEYGLYKSFEDFKSFHENHRWGKMDARTVYRVLLPTQPDVKEVVKTKEEIAKEIAKEILYSQVTNGKHKESIVRGAKLIQEYADRQVSAYKQQVLTEIEKEYNTQYECRSAIRALTALIKVIKEL